MATTMKRFTISITPEIEAELDSAKKEKFYKQTQSEMIRCLLMRGLTTLKTEKQESAS